jgi:serine acetyltransferase
MWNTIATDFQVIFERDPAARNWLEVCLCYPGWHALVFHRIAHHIQQLIENIYQIPRQKQSKLYLKGLNP